MNFIELVISNEYATILEQLTDDVQLDLQTVGAIKGKNKSLELLKKQNEYLENEITEIKIFRQFEDDNQLVVEYDILLKNTFDLPLVAVITKNGAQYNSIRTYHSVYPLTEGHIYRASIFDRLIPLVEPTEVVHYFDAISKGSIEKTMRTLSFEDDVYFREPAGWRWNHKSKAGLHEHFKHFFADGGVPLKFHNYIFDKNKGSFAGEYTCDVWGSASFKPQAGISIYDINKDTGKIKAIRVYDNVDTTYV
ncbi:hypothetical protein CLV90_2296 [Maribacter spongiicola]|uniref:SnoaL-like protein n=1 Tax=Maribacter spongiicola TaxID=1206753 RepID=A0A4R7K2W1_9FLAO|nr:hypothetical protein [Maribacter spongiicola]TDT45211.1 hypothetical protein CLV90_2296 [Maribacter spongiicola]